MKSHLILFFTLAFCSLCSLLSAEPAAWNTHLSTSDGGTWKKRVAFELQISPEVLAELNAQNADKLGGDEKTAKEATGMNSKLEPTLFTFTVAAPGTDAARDENPLPLAGARAQDVRICTGKNVEYLFEILGTDGLPQHSGTLEPGTKIVVPIELTTLEEGTVFYVYYENPKAWEQSDWWNVHFFQNGSFEEGETGPLGWHFDSSDATHKIERASSGARTGKMCIKTTVADGAEASWIAARQSGIPVRTGEKYRISGWTKAENVNGYAGWYWHLGNDHNGMVGGGMLTAGDGTFDWKESTAEFVVPANVDRLEVGTVLRGTGTAWADDVKIELIEKSVAAPKVPVSIGEVETFPLVDVFPARGSKNGAAQFDAQEFFGNAAETPRFAFIRVENSSDEVRKPLVNVKASLISARWRVEMTPENVEILGLDGEPLDVDAWDSSLFITPTLPPKSISWLIIAEKPTAVSSGEAARRVRDQQTSDSGFPGTSLQQVKTAAKSISLKDLPALKKILARNENLVQNPGYEELDQNGKPVAWNVDAPKDGITFNAIDPQAENDALGKYCAEIKIDPGKRASWSGWRQNFKIQGGRSYFCGAWMKSPTATQFAIHIHFHTAAGKLCDSGGMTSFGGTAVGPNEWSLVSGLIRTPDDAAEISLQLTTNESETLCYDDVFVMEMDAGIPENFQGGSTGIFQVSPIIKVFPDSTWSRNPEELKKAAPHGIVTAKNEEETIQFAFRYAKDLKFQVALEPAVSADGKTTLPTDLFAIGYVPIKHVTNYYSTRQAKWFRKLPKGSGRADGWVGMWPDPMIRFINIDSTAHGAFAPKAEAEEAFKTLENAEFKSDSERLARYTEQNLIEFRAWETRALTVQVKTTKETPAGIYRGRIWLKSIETGKVTSVPFSVEVKDFAILDEPAVCAIYDIRMTHPEFWNRKEGEDLSQSMVEYVTSKRLSSDRMRVEPKFTYDKETGAWSVDFTEFDAACEHYFNDLKVKFSYLPGDWYCFGWGMPPRARQGIQPYEGEWPFEGADRRVLRPEFKKVYQDKLRLMWNHLKEKGWDKHFVLYISDEPFYSKPEIIAQMQACCEMIHEVDPNIPIYCSTWHHIPEWDGYITVWGIGHYGCVPEEQIYKSLKRGDRIWWTTDGQMCTDTPFCATERLLPYWAVKYQADGYEFWGGSWFTIDPYRYGWHSYIHQSDQPGVEYYVLYPNGDGFIFYPDKLIGRNEIVPSVRLEQAREGVEDAAYLQILQVEIARVSKIQNLAPADAQTLKNARNTLARAFDLVHIPNAGGRYTSVYLPNPEEVDEVKTLMVQLIDALKKI